jgi:hypothetical protein
MPGIKILKNKFIQNDKRKLLFSSVYKVSLSAQKNYETATKIVSFTGRENFKLLLLALFFGNYST